MFNDCTEEAIRNNAADLLDQAQLIGCEQGLGLSDRQTNGWIFVHNPRSGCKTISDSPATSQLREDDRPLYPCHDVPSCLTAGNPRPSGGCNTRTFPLCRVALSGRQNQPPTLARCSLMLDDRGGGPARLQQELHC